jgi:hypothetical protein
LSLRGYAFSAKKPAVNDAAEQTAAHCCHDFVLIDFIQAVQPGLD